MTFCDDSLKTEVAQGSRSDLKKIASDLASGELDRRSLLEVAPEYLLKFPRGVQAILETSNLRMATVMRTALHVEIFWGPAGIGKTRHAMGDLDDVFILDASNSDTLWFDGYYGQKTLVIDDFYGWIKHGTLLRILDIYPYRCPVKGGHVWAGWTNVRVTSNRHPSSWYPSRPWAEDQALRRRIHRIWATEKDLLGNTNFKCELSNLSMCYDQEWNKY